MKADTYTLQVLLVTVAGWVNRHQQEVIDYLVEENRVLKEQMKGRRLRQAPDCNAYAERFMLSIKSECLSKMIFFGEASLRRAISEYLDHYHSERAHQGLGNDRIENHEVTPEGEIRCRERLGGILKHYYRAA